MVKVVVYKNSFVFLLFFAISYSLITSFSFAMLAERNENVEHPKRRTSRGELSNPSPQKRSKTDHMVADENTPPTSLHALNSPISAERKYLSPFRRDIIQNPDISSPEFRKTSQRVDQGNHWTNSILFQEKTVYQNNHLFDPKALVLTKDGKWETNLNRMKRGACPVAYKGTSHSPTATVKEILQNQKKYRIELHHWTKKDSNTPQDPIVEITYAAHMGKNARFIVEEAPIAGGDCIIHSSLEKEEALRLCKDNQKIKTNILHEIRTGKSLIDRDEFSTWRIAYWKNRAETIEKEKFKKSDFTYQEKPVRLFQNCNFR
jgi:hypothetical protein